MSNDDSRLIFRGILFALPICLAIWAALALAVAAVIR